MKHRFLFPFLFLVSLPLWCGNNYNSLVSELDKVIKDRPVYQAEKENRISTLKQNLIHATDDEQRYNIYGALLEQYRAYDTDSSIVYSERRYQLAQRLNRREFIYDSTMNMAELLGMAGMYMESLKLLNSLDRKTIPDYLRTYNYHLYRTIYGLMSDYAITNNEKVEYARITDLYRDSLLVAHEGDKLNYSMVKADQLTVHGKYDEAINLLTDIYNDPSYNTHTRAMLAYTLSEAYRLKGDREQEKKFLYISAIADLKSAVREYISLRKLATLVYEDGDVARAYNYLKCSLEDATLCNARLRTLEISQVFPIIDNAYQLKVANQKKQMSTFMICVSILSFFLLIAVFLVYRQMRKVAVARREVMQANEKLKLLNDELNLSNNELKKANDSLSEINHIKEEYIARYMDQCSVYLDKMDAYRRSLGKLASAGKVDELYKTIKSNKFIEEELKEFYSGFDSTFLQLFPDFVEDFNALLSEKIYPKSGELLNTELRIFALIRLGITDSIKIAQFLRYSITTIYNYRTRVRNKAEGERDNFENKVMKL